MNRKLIAVALATVTAVAPALPASAATPSWGLDRIDSATLDGNYSVPYTGSGVTAYVIDTGVAISDSGFGGRAVGDVDCNSHGTHVAGIIGSSQYGVARSVNIVSVKVTLDCSGAVVASDLVRGIDSVIAMHRAKGGPAVANISITLAKNALIDSAIDRLYSAGILPVVAASNTNSDACAYSPSGVSKAFVVASINKNTYRTNNSAFGPCVDIFAPGGLIVSESLLQPNGGITKSGTSMAAPHVTGVAALYLEKNPLAKPAEVAGALRAGALAGVVVDAKSENGNYLVNTAFLSSDIQATPVELGATEKPAKVTGLVARKAIIANSYTLYWSLPSNSSAALVNGYIIEASSNNRTWTTIANPTNASLNYTVPIYKYYRITALGQLGAGPVSSTIMVR
jgi:serine protease